MSKMIKAEEYSKWDKNLAKEKELTPLEALNEFRILVGDYEKKWDKKTYDYFMNNVNIIENALKENVELKQMIRNFNEAIGEPQIIDIPTEKKLKAFDLLIKKLDMETLLHWLKEHTTDEEFELLKEVLL